MTTSITQSTDDPVTQDASSAPTPTMTAEELYLVERLARWLADVALSPFAGKENPDDEA